VEDRIWPRIKDLPIDQQEPFNAWLSGQTCPFIEGVKIADQDAYYPWDYDRFARGLAVVD
jgi:hypothetical protein